MRTSSLLALCGLVAWGSAVAAAPPSGARFWPARIDLDPPRGFTTALADVNGDGISDYIVADDGVVRVRCGTGDGTFDSVDCVAIDVGGPVQEVFVDDLNADGRADIVLSGSGLRVLLAQPGGDFGDPVTTPIEGWVVERHLADLDGDSYPDFLIHGRVFIEPGVYVWVVRTYAGQGDGGFATPTTFQVGARYSHLYPVDIDGRAPIDFIAHTTTVIQVFLRDQGDVTLPWLDAQDWYVRDARLPHFDDDDVLDLAVAGGTSGVAFGTSPGEFGPLVSVPLASEWSDGVFPADIDGDGRMDLLGTEDSYSTSLGVVSVALNRGDRTFAPARHSAVGEYAVYRVHVGNLNDDDLPDVIVRSNDQLSIFQNLGSGILADGKKHGTVGRPMAMSIVDVDGDGEGDIVATTFSTGSGPVSRGIEVLTARGDGTFSSVSLLDIPGRYRAILTGDLDADGAVDAVLLNNRSGEEGMIVARGTGDGTFALLQPLGLDPWLSRGALAHIDGDEYLDLVVTGGGVTVLLGMGDGTFGPPTHTDLGKTTAVVTARLDTDDREGVVVVSDGGVIVLSPDEGGILQVSQVSDVDADFIYDIAAHDVDGDGHADIVASGSRDLHVLLGTGDGMLQPPMSSPAVRGMETLRAGDVTGDGIPDILFTTYRDGIQVMEGIGDGTFVLDPLGYGTDTYSLGIALADVDHDGRLDVLALDPLVRAITVLPGVAQTPTPIDPPGGTGTAPQAFRLASTPNPFSSSTRLRFGLPEAGRVSITIFDVAGRQVRALLRDAFIQPGTTELSWDGRTDRGDPAVPGVYLVHIDAGAVRATTPLTRLP